MSNARACTAPISRATSALKVVSDSKAPSYPIASTSPPSDNFSTKTNKTSPLLFFFNLLLLFSYSIIKKNRVFFLSLFLQFLLSLSLSLFCSVFVCRVCVCFSVWRRFLYYMRSSFTTYNKCIYFAAISMNSFQSCCLVICHKYIKCCGGFKTEGTEWKATGSE